MNPEATPTPAPDQQLIANVANSYADLSAWIKDAASSTGAFLTDQTPLFIQEYLGWIFWNNFISATAGAIALIICIVAILRLIKWVRGMEDCDDAIVPAGFIISIVCMGALVLLVATYTCAMNVVKVKVAPRVVLVEKIGTLIK